MFWKLSHDGAAGENLVVFGIKIIDFPLEIDFRTLQKAKNFRLRRKNPRKLQIINLAA